MQRKKWRKAQLNYAGYRCQNALWRSRRERLVLYTLDQDQTSFRNNESQATRYLGTY